MLVQFSETDHSMTTVYNLLREACGLSQAEAAEFVHGTRLDSVKSWCSDRRVAPQGVIFDLQKLAREIQKAGVEYANLLKRTTRGDVYIVGLPVDEQDARACGFPSVGAQMRAIAIAVSYLPEGSEIRMVERVRGAVSGPVLEKEKPIPTEADGLVLSSMRFTNNKFQTTGNVNRRKYDRLEELGWIKGVATSISDVEYCLTSAGVVQLALSDAATRMREDVPDPAPGGFQTKVNSSPRRGPILKLELNKKYQVGELSFRIDKIEGELVSIRLQNGEVATLRASEILFSPVGLREV